MSVALFTITLETLLFIRYQMVKMRIDISHTLWSMSLTLTVRIKRIPVLSIRSTGNLIPLVLPLFRQLVVLYF